MANKLLRERYKTLEGARKRVAFENAMAKGEYERGDKAKLYRYRAVRVLPEPDYRVERVAVESDNGKR